MKISIFGFIGTGKSSIGIALSKRLNYKFFSAGYFMREEAKERKLSIEDFDVVCAKNPQIDVLLDKKMARAGRENDNIIFEGRLAWMNVPDSFKIKLVCEEDTILERIAKRENVSLKEAKRRIKERHDIVTKRLKKLYKEITYPPEDKNFDLILDTTRLSIDESVEIILKTLSEKKDKKVVK